MQSKITIEKYNPDWAKQFEELKTVLLSKIQKDIVVIEHVDSTSVVGLSAKAILDIDIIIEDDSEIEKQVIEKLASFGYQHIGNLGISGREAFKKENKWVPFAQEDKKWMAHNLYLCRENSIGLQNHLIFRDYLRANQKAVETYGKLKQELAEKFPYNIEKYIDGKTNFIASILEKQGMNAAIISSIADENKI